MGFLRLWVYFILIAFASLSWAEKTPPKEPKVKTWTLKKEAETTAYCSPKEEGEGEDCVPRDCIEDDEKQNTGQKPAEGADVEDSVVGKNVCITESSLGANENCKEAMKEACKKVLSTSDDGKKNPGVIGQEMIKACEKDGKKPKIVERYWQALDRKTKKENGPQGYGEYSSKEKKGATGCDEVIKGESEIMDACFPTTSKSTVPKAQLAIQYKCVDKKEAGDEPLLDESSSEDPTEQLKKKKQNNGQQDEAI